MNNRDWLFSLPLEEQYAWMNAEHAESPTSATMQHIGQVIESTVKRGVYGDTESENADSRDKLEAEVRSYFPRREECAETVIGWLDRQAAITEEKTRYKWVTASAEEIAAWRSKAEKLKEQVYELTAERDELQERLNCTTAAMNRAAGKWARANEQCNEYREKFSKCIDYADAIHALMDDEGIA